MLGQRILTAAIGAPVALAVVIVGDPWLSLLVGVALVVALLETGRLLATAGYLRRTWPMILVGVLIGGGVLAVATDRSLLVGAASPWLALIVTIAAVAVMALAVASLDAGDPRRAVGEWAAGLLGALYVGLLLPCLALLDRMSLAGGGSATDLGPWEIRAGAGWLLFLLAIVWSFDSGAYFGGRRFGRRRLAPMISPGKTIEGVIAGAIVAALAGAVAGWWWMDLHPVVGAVMGALVGVIGQVGDLCESLLKRAAGEKDAGTLFPGHGGLLDRIDSLLFAGPVLLLLAVALGSVPAVP